MPILPFIAWLRLFVACLLSISGAMAAAPVILTQPDAEASLAFGGTGIGRVTATGALLSYQWYRGETGDTSTPVPGATGPLLVTPPLTKSGSYWVRVTNADGSVDSSAMTISVAPAVPLALMAMGGNTYGQLGLGSTTSQLLPARAALGVVQAAGGSGAGFSLFVKADGTLWGMGDNIYGQLAIGGNGPPAPTQIETEVTMVAAGEDHCLILKRDGTLLAAGSATYGQLGLPALGGRYSAPVATGVAWIAAGRAYSLFVKTDGSLWAMGLNSVGQMGAGTVYSSSTPIQVATDVVRVSAGEAHSLFIRADDTAWAMGYNGSGQLGDGTTTRRTTPVMVLSGVAEVAVGYAHSLFVKTDGTLWAAGSNSYGQLGDGTFIDQKLPVQIATNVVTAAGDHTSYASGSSFFVKQDGTLWAMGYNGYGRLGDGTTTSRSTPVQVATGVSAVVCGSKHTLFTQTPPPAILTQPGEVGIVTGSSATLMIDAQSSGPVTWQWYAGASGNVSAPVSGATTTTFVTPALGTTTTYWARLTNAYGSTDSATITVTVCTPPAIGSGPQPLSLLTGQGATLSVTAAGGVLTYQWYRGATGDTSAPVVGAAGAILSTGSLTESGYYWVRVSNAAGAADSAAALVTVFSAADLMASGENSYGQLGLGTTGNVTPAITITDGVTKIAGGGQHTLFLKADGTLWAAGSNQYGQLGDGTTVDRATPVQITTGVVEIAAGSLHSVFVKTDGTAWATGYNSSGQLGDGTTTNRATPVQIAIGVTRVAAGGSHTLLLKAGGLLYACGSRTYGQLGNGIDTSSVSRTLIQVADQVADIAAGANHSLALKTDATLWTTGYNSSGQLGNGSTTNLGAFGQITTGVARIAAGGSCTWFVKSDGSLWTVGDGSSGQLANGGMTSRSTPGQVASDVARIALGGNHGLFIKTDASLWATGLNASGQFGDGTVVSSRANPVKIAEGMTQIAAGLLHSLFVTTDGTLRAAGYNSYGQLGNGQYGSLLVPGFARAGIVATAAGTVHTLFVTADHTLWGVGRNNLGQLGDGTTLDRATPVAVATGVESVVAGSLCTWFIKTDHSLWGMGSTSYSSIRYQPTLIAQGVRQVTTSGDHTLFVKTDGTLWGMGSNYAGQLGLSMTTRSSTVPVQIASQVAQAAASEDLFDAFGFSAFLKTDGTLWTMGYNGTGQLGIGTGVSKQYAPVQIASDVTQIATGARQLLFVKRNATLWGTGLNHSGELGLGAVTSKSLPTQIATNVAQVVSGYHTLFRKQDGSLWATGPNSFGQLGEGTRTTRFTPVQVATGVLDMTVGGTHSLFLRIPAPVILTDPSPVVARIGTQVEFSVTVTALPGVPLAYQWRRDGVPLATATATSNRFVIESALLSDAGDYDVVVTHGGVSSTSEPASLTVHTEDQTTYAAWASANAVSGNASDAPDGGGVPNLLRYAFKLPAHGPVGSPLTVQTAADAGGTWLTVTFKRKTYAPGLSYVIEASDDLVTWTGISTVQPGLPETVVARDSQPAPAAGRRFLRVRVDAAP